MSVAGEGLEEPIATGDMFLCTGRGNLKIEQKRKAVQRIGGGLEENDCIFKKIWLA